MRVSPLFRFFEHPCNLPPPPQTMNADYALLPMNAPDGEDPYSASGGGAAAGGKKKD